MPGLRKLRGRGIEHEESRTRSRGRGVEDEESRTRSRGTGSSEPPTSVPSIGTPVVKRRASVTQHRQNQTVLDSRIGYGCAAGMSALPRLEAGRSADRGPSGFARPEGGEPSSRRGSCGCVACDRSITLVARLSTRRRFPRGGAIAPTGPPRRAARRPGHPRSQKQDPPAEALPRSVRPVAVSSAPLPPHVFFRTSSSESCHPRPLAEALSDGSAGFHPRGIPLGFVGFDSPDRCGYSFVSPPRHSGASADFGPSALPRTEPRPRSSR